MPFYNFQNSTTAYADDTNDNFYHLAQGTVEPKANTGTMALTTGVYDLGSSTTTWKQLYCNNIYANTTTLSGKIWKQIYHITVTTASIAINVTGLNCDELNELYIVLNLGVSVLAAQVTLGNFEPYIYFNTWGTNSNYHLAGYAHDGSSITGLLYDTYNRIILSGHYNGAANKKKMGVYAELHVSAKTGKFRYIKYRTASGESGSQTVENIKNMICCWPFSTLTITSISFDVSGGINERWKYGEITIYSKEGS